MGYTQSELNEAQRNWNLRFPPDLVELLLEPRPLIGGRGSFDWVLSDPVKIQERLDWPLEGFWFDVEHNQVWWTEWGEKPEEISERHDRLKEIFLKAPKLIPLFANRYVPEEPFERNNPVFSVYQTDVIYYGASLLDWLDRERLSPNVKARPPIEDVKSIPFWSDAVARNDSPPAE